MKSSHKFSKSRDIAIQAKESNHHRSHHLKHDHHDKVAGSHNHRPNIQVYDELKANQSKSQAHLKNINKSNTIPTSYPEDMNYGRADSGANSEYYSYPDSHTGKGTQKTAAENDRAEYSIDQNWRLQMRLQGNSAQDGVSQVESGLARGWSHDSDNDYNPHEDRYKHSQIPGITNVAPPAHFHFPNNSIFRAGSEESAEDLGIIEEEIERAQRVRLVAVKGSNQHQGGYVTTKTEDGREIFIPASYAAKPSGGTNSGSSGYGSSGGGYSSALGSSSYSSIPSSKTPSDFNRQVHKTASAATVSSFEDDILEVLPGMADVEERPKRHSEGMLKELFKAKRDALEEGLIESYEERVRRGELGKLDDLPDGVVFPKKNKDQQYSPTVEELLTGRRANADDSHVHSDQDLQDQGHQQQDIDHQQGKQQQQQHLQDQQQQQHKVNKKSDNEHAKPDDPDPIKRPMTAAPTTSSTSITQRMQRGVHRPLSASNTSFREWNARSSLKRNKARAALKRALSAKGHQRTPHQPQQQGAPEERGSRAKEIELKYSSRPGSAMSLVSSVDSDLDFVEEDIGHIQKAHIESQDHMSAPREKILNNASLSFVPERHFSSGLPAVEESPTKRTLHEIIESDPTVTNKRATSSRPTVARKPSTKSRPAPPPPPDHTLSAITVSSTSPPSQPSTTDAIAPDSTPEDSQNVSEYDTDTQSASPHQADESFTSVEPASSSKSSSTANTNTYSNASDPSDQAAEKIESDMHEIINSSATSAVHDQRGNPLLPPGIRLIDSGFDSASISSEESCLCAAAALEAIDDGDASGPSEIFSQGTCSCACSNCLGSNTKGDKRNGSSWTGSQDSESWSNSNSFSSYDANMHRRMLPSKREKDVSGCVLAPDEQYPLPSHSSRSKRSHSLHPHTGYSPKRNHRQLSSGRGQHTSSASETSSVASRRYRELVKKGVPLRVSVVGKADDALSIDQNSSIPENDDAQYSEIQGDGHLFKDLQQKGFFERDRIAGSLQFIDSPRSNHFSEEENEDNEEDERYQGLSPIPSLEDIIKEIPDETGQFPDETKAFLNRPESEVSIKALQAVLSRTGSSVEDKSTHPGELIIDRIFTHQGPSETMASTFGLSRNGLDLDVSAIREVAMLPGPGSPNDLAVGVDIIGLLAGMDGRHVTYCHRLSSQLRLVSITDLLPATPQAFEKLKLRLQQTGRVGSIGNQVRIDLLYVSC